SFETIRETRGQMICETTTMNSSAFLDTNAVRNLSKAESLPPQAMICGMRPAKFAFAKKELKPLRHPVRKDLPSPPPST
ncbi:MAG: hypothetical protein OXP75_05565, partial [Rhodospirillales bacterium]|nr:hypothetical protein [Rhodospirillales bacterium]